jgi:hypothetical protein
MKKIIFLVGFLVVSAYIFNFSPSNANAMTATELKALIQQLQQQIAQLQSQLSEAEGQETAWCHDFNVNLKIGDFNSDVDSLRKALQREGFSDLENTIAGEEFDEIVASAVVGFQEKYKSEILSPYRLKNGTGFVGKSTRAKLNKLYGCGSSAPAATVSSPTVLSPNGGEQWKAGETHDIKWNFSGTEGNVYISLDKWASDRSSVSVKSIISKISAVSGTYSWTIPESQEAGSYYKVSIGLIDGRPKGSASGGDDSNNYFSIVAAQTNTSCADSDNGKDYNVKGKTVEKRDGQVYTYTDFCYPGGSTVGEYFCSPSTNEFGKSEDYVCPNGCKDGACVKNAASSITVISPNGGEQWVAGGTYDITWKAEGINGFEIYLRDDRAVTSYKLIATGISSASRNYSWTIPSDFGGDYTVGSAYKIQIREKTGVAGGEYKYDESNNYFSIVSSTTALLDEVFIENLTPLANPVSYEVITAPSLGDERPGVTYSWRYQMDNNSAQDIELSYEAVYSSSGEEIRQDVLGGGAIVLDNNGVSDYYELGSSVTLAKGAKHELHFSLFMETPLEVDLALKITITKVVAATTTPSITVTSPNGREVWTTGETYNITWSATAIEKVMIQLESEDYVAGGRTIAENIDASLGTYSFYLDSAFNPTNIAKIKISSEEWIEDHFVIDYSDNHFSIVAATGTEHNSALKNVENQLGSISSSVSALMEQIRRMLGR